MNHADDGGAISRRCHRRTVVWFGPIVRRRRSSCRCRGIPGRRRRSKRDIIDDERAAAVTVTSSGAVVTVESANLVVRQPKRRLLALLKMLNLDAAQ